MNSGGQGAILNQDSTPNAAANPAGAGSLVSVYATGLGPTDPDLATGSVGASTEPLNRTVTMPDVIIAGICRFVPDRGQSSGGNSRGELGQAALDFLDPITLAVKLVITSVTGNPPRASKVLQRAHNRLAADVPAQTHFDTAIRPRHPPCRRRCPMISPQTTCLVGTSGPPEARRQGCGTWPPEAPEPGANLNLLVFSRIYPGRGV
jgi:hypothetical protein